MHAPLSWAALIAICVVASNAAAQTNASVGSGKMARAVEVKVKHSRPMRGMTATQKVTISGSVDMDSYDSALGPWSLANKGDKGFIGTTAKTASYLEISGSVKLAGQIGTGAPGVLKLNGGSATVGSGEWVASSSGIETGYLMDDINVSYPDAILPFTPSASTPAPTSGTVNGTNYNFVLGDGNYVVNSVVLGTGTKAIVTGKAVLYVKGDVSITGGAFLRMEPDATLDIYVAGQTSISGGAIVNISGKPEALSYFGLPSNVQFYLSGSAAFIGLIYAPRAKLDFAGTSDFYGASVSKEIVLSGSFYYHYDEALSRKGVQYLPISWKEL